MKIKKNIWTVILLTCIISLSNAQRTNELMAPLPTDKILGAISIEETNGYIRKYKKTTIETSTDAYGNKMEKEIKAGTIEEEPAIKDESRAHIAASSEVYKRFPMYGECEIRDLRWTISERKRESACNYYFDQYDRIMKISATVVQPNASSSMVNGDDNPLPRAIDKALQDIREGSRIAIDQVRVLSGMDKNEYKDQIVEILLDKGYKVVAKEYLEKLYEEQQAQQSGIYNNKTTVKENNFSAVGYYLNVRLTETSLRVQVINVSTGEYDANVTIKL